MEDIVLCGMSSCLVLITSERTRKRKRWWTRELLAGPRFGNALLNKLRLEDVMGFRNFTRLTPTDFEHLLLMVGGIIMKQHTKFRETIPASLRLAVTLRFLASGDSFTSLMYTFRISKQAISKMVPEVFEAIISSLKQYVKRPISEATWKAISQEFDSRWNFPHCIGSIDGKHVQMAAPKHSGSLYLNYKGTFSIVFLGVADANYNLLYADVGCQGRISDGVFSSSPHCTRI